MKITIAIISMSLGLILLLSNLFIEPVEEEEAECYDRYRREIKDVSCINNIYPSSYYINIIYGLILVIIGLCILINEVMF